MSEFKFHFNKNLAPIFTSDATVFDLAGGRGRGGSHGITDYFLFKITQPDPFRGYFMRFIHGDIRGSLWQDLKDRIDENESIDELDFKFNESQMEVMYLPTGNQIKSKGFRKSQGSQTAKLKSIAGATHIAIEECEEIGENDFDKLADSLRSTKAKLQIFRIWNPPNKDHWLIKNYFDIIPNEEFEGYYNFVPKNIKGHCAIISNYKDNIKNINEATIERFENYRVTNPDHYASDIVGLVSSSIKGQIYKDWRPFKDLPDRNFYRVFGLDFGFTNDPNALAEILIDKDAREVYVYERLYSTHMLNYDLIRSIKKSNPKSDEIVCDNSKPDAIVEMQNARLNAFATKKGGQYGDIVHNIGIVKGYTVFYHQNSSNIIFEKDNYHWAVNPDTKEPVNKPIDRHNHILDAIRYGICYFHRSYCLTQ